MMTIAAFLPVVFQAVIVDISCNWLEKVYAESELDIQIISPSETQLKVNKRCQRRVSISTSLALSLTSSSKLRSDQRYLPHHLVNMITEWGSASRRRI